MSLLLLFPGSGGPVTQGGFRSFTAFWMGGAGASAAAGVSLVFAPRHPIAHLIVR